MLDDNQPPHAAEPGPAPQEASGRARGPYRPMPHDFAEAFARVGWDGIEAEVRAHKTTIKAWMLEYGEDELRRMRREVLEARYAALGKRIPGVKPGQRAKRYVLGLTVQPRTAKRLRREREDG